MKLSNLLYLVLSL